MDRAKKKVEPWDRMMPYRLFWDHHNADYPPKLPKKYMA